MNFSESLDIISNIIPECTSKEYDGIMVKKLEASNTLEGENNQSDTYCNIW